MNTETELKSVYRIYRNWYKDNIRLRMAHANCIKAVIEMAARVIPQYQIIYNQVENKVWFKWRKHIKNDAIREKFLSWGLHWVDKPCAGDLLFISLHYEPVDHIGLCLNNKEFVHLLTDGLYLELITDYKDRIVNIGRL